MMQTVAPAGTFSGTGTVNVNPLPTAMLSLFDENFNTITDGTICSGDTVFLGVTFPGNSPGGYQFSYSDGFNTINVPGGPFSGAVTLPLNPTVTTTTTFNYSLISVTDQTTTCTSTSAPQLTGSAILNVNPLPTATIAYNGSPYCATGTATVTQTGTAGGTYTSPAGLVINATTGDIDLVASTPGTYTITYSFSDGTCSNTTTASITINALPTATIAYMVLHIAQPVQQLYTQTGTAGGTYSSPAGVVINAATGDIDLVASTPGTYTVTYSFTDGTCSNTTTASITITALPTATIAYNGSPYCATGTATVTQTGTAGGTYTSPAGVVINAATGDIDLVASTPGTYTVTYSFPVVHVAIQQLLL